MQDGCLGDIIQLRSMQDVASCKRRHIEYASSKTDFVVDR